METGGARSSPYTQGCGVAACALALPHAPGPLACTPQPWSGLGPPQARPAATPTLGPQVLTSPRDAWLPRGSLFQASGARADPVRDPEGVAAKEGGAIRGCREGGRGAGGQAPALGAGSAAGEEREGGRGQPGWGGACRNAAARLAAQPRPAPSVWTSYKGSG